MTVYASDQIDQLRDLLEDAADSQVTFARKLYFLNAGQRAMWPRVYQIVQDSSTTFTDDQYEYTIPAAVRGGRIFQLEKSLAADTDYFYPFDIDDYNIQRVSTAGADKIILNWDPGSTYGDTGVIRITSALPLTPYTAAAYAASQSEVYTGPDYTLEGPVLYAMSRISAIPLDDRMDHGRISVQAQNRAASPQEYLAVSAYWLDEFERRVEEWNLPLPASRY
jgi:hypothetical protein